MSTKSKQQKITQLCRVVVPTLFVGAILLSSGCGFHLRGNQLLPSSFAQLSIDCDNTLSAICQQLTKTLSTQGISIQADSPMQLSLGQFNEDRRAVSITTNAIAAEYQLTQSITFSLHYSNSDQEVIRLLDKAETLARQTYRYDDSSVIGKSREESEIRAILETKLTNQLIKRLTPFNSWRINQVTKKQLGKVTP